MTRINKLWNALYDYDEKYGSCEAWELLKKNYAPTEKELKELKYIYDETFKF